jgi:hypothetical protein
VVPRKGKRVRKHTCKNCFQRRAVFVKHYGKHDGRAGIKVGWDAQHDTCMRCYASEVDRLRARNLAARLARIEAAEAAQRAEWESFLRETTNASDDSATALVAYSWMATGSGDVLGVGCVGQSAQAGA